MRTHSKQNAGLTLIEVLVALLVLSVGAFSLLMANSASMRLATDSMRTSIAVAAGNDLMRLQEVLLRRHPQLAESAGFSKGQPLIVGRDCGRETCEAKDLQTFLQHSWRCSLAQAPGCANDEHIEALPEFDAELLVDGATGGFRLRMEWRDKVKIRHLELDNQVQ